MWSGRNDFNGMLERLILLPKICPFKIKNVEEFQVTEIKHHFSEHYDRKGRDSIIVEFEKKYGLKYRDLYGKLLN